jgi:hypothetical protein
MERQRHGEAETWRGRDMERQRHGEAETWRHGDRAIGRSGDSGMRDKRIRR